MAIQLNKVLSALPSTRRKRIDARARELVAEERARRDRTKRNAPHFKIQKDQKGHWHWQLVSASGKLIASSAEKFKTMKSCVAAIATVKQASSADVEIEEVS